MAYFDFLNTPAKTPDSSARYWYDFHMVWDRSLSFMDSRQDTARGRVVHKLSIEHPQSGFTFEFADEPGKEYHCNYTWAFVRCSPRNWVLRKLRDGLERVIGVATSIKERICSKLDSLEDSDK